MCLAYQTAWDYLLYDSVILRNALLLTLGGVLSQASWSTWINRVASTHDLNAILFPPNSDNTVRCIAV